MDKTDRSPVAFVAVVIIFVAIVVVSNLQCRNFGPDWVSCDGNGVTYATEYRMPFSKAIRLKKRQDALIGFDTTTADGHVFVATLEAKMELSTDTERLRQMFLAGNLRADQLDKGILVCREGRTQHFISPDFELCGWVRLFVGSCTSKELTKELTTTTVIKAPCIKEAVERKFPVTWDGVITLSDAQIYPPSLNIRIEP